MAIAKYDKADVDDTLLAQLSLSHVVHYQRNYISLHKSIFTKIKFYVRERYSRFFLIYKHFSIVKRDIAYTNY